MALSDEEKQQLAALQAKESEPDPEDYQIEIWDDSGAGAKLPYSKGKTWLQRFGIDLPVEAAEEDQGQPKQPKSGSGKGGSNVTHAQKYFGNKNRAS